MAELCIKGSDPSAPLHCNRFGRTGVAHGSRKTLAKTITLTRKEGCIRANTRQDVEEIQLKNIFN